jgi:hypothetical protein
MREWENVRVNWMWLWSSVSAEFSPGQQIIVSFEEARLSHSFAGPSRSASASVHYRPSELRLSDIGG